MGDVAALVPDEQVGQVRRCGCCCRECIHRCAALSCPVQADVCVLEEPEHLSWFKAPFVGKDWTSKFRYVLGVIHTNYQIYIKHNHWMAAPFIFVANQSETLIQYHTVSYSVHKVSYI